MDLPYKRHRASLSDSAGGGALGDENQHPVYGGSNNSSNKHNASSSHMSSRTGSPVPMALSLPPFAQYNQQQQQRPLSNRTSPIPSALNLSGSGSALFGTSGGSNHHRQHSRGMSGLTLMAHAQQREVEPDTPTMRLSRHVPNRDEMDLSASSFNLASGNIINSNGNGNAGANSHRQLLLGGDGDDLDGSLHALDGSGMMLHLDDDDASSGNGSMTAMPGASATGGGVMAMMHRVPSDSEDSMLAYRESLAQGLGAGTGGDVLRFARGNSGAGASASSSAAAMMNGNGNGNGSNNVRSISPPPPSGALFSMNGGPSVSPTPAVMSFGGGGGASSASASRGREDGFGSSLSQSIVGGGGNGGSSHRRAGSSSSGFRGSTTSSRAAGGGGPSSYHQRPLHFNPDKVLDAPDLPTEPCDLLDWGSTNKLVIGLRSTLYVWDAEDGSARSVTDIAADQFVTGVAWLRGCQAAAMCVNRARILLADANTGAIARTLCPALDLGVGSSSSSACGSRIAAAAAASSSGGDAIDSAQRIVSSMSVCGPLVAAATTLGTVCLYDVRAPNMVGHFEAHGNTSSGNNTSSSAGGVGAVGGALGALTSSTTNILGRTRSGIGSGRGGNGGVAKAVFSAAEPHYLATGGAADGCVRLWDYRNTAMPRYSFDRVFFSPSGGGGGSGSNGGGMAATSVSALCFFADKRSIVYAGGSDGTLLALNTHGTADDFVVSRVFCGPAPITSIVSPSGTGEIATSHGTGFGTLPPPQQPQQQHAGGDSAAFMNGGVVQLRRAYKFQLLGQFSGPGTTAGINCLTLAPDGERVCGAQLDETLKFWRVFESRSAGAPQQAFSSGSSSSTAAQSSTSGARIRPRQDREADDAVGMDLR